MTLDEAITEYRKKEMPIDKLILLVNSNYTHKNIEIEDLNSYLDEYEEEEEPQLVEYLNTNHGKIKILRSRFINKPTLIDETTILKINNNGNINYK